MIVQNKVVGRAVMPENKANGRSPLPGQKRSQMNVIVPKMSVDISASANKEKVPIKPYSSNSR